MNFIFHIWYNKKKMFNWTRPFWKKSEKENGEYNGLVKELTKPVTKPKKLVTTLGLKQNELDEKNNHEQFSQKLNIPMKFKTRSTNISRRPLTHLDEQKDESKRWMKKKLQTDESELCSFDASACFQRGQIGVGKSNCYRFCFKHMKVWLTNFAMAASSKSLQFGSFQSNVNNISLGVGVQTKEGITWKNVEWSPRDVNKSFFGSSSNKLEKFVDDIQYHFYSQNNPDYRGVLQLCYVVDRLPMNNYVIRNNSKIAQFIKAGAVVEVGAKNQTVHYQDAMEPGNILRHRGDQRIICITFSNVFYSLDISSIVPNERQQREELEKLQDHKANLERQLQMGNDKNKATENKLEKVTKQIIDTRNIYRKQQAELDQVRRQNTYLASNLEKSRQSSDDSGLSTPEDTVFEFGFPDGDGRGFNPNSGKQMGMLGGNPPPR